MINIANMIINEISEHFKCTLVNSKSLSVHRSNPFRIRLQASSEHREHFFIKFYFYGGGGIKI